MCIRLIHKTNLFVTKPFQLLESTPVMEEHASNPHNDDPTLLDLLRQHGIELSRADLEKAFPTYLKQEFLDMFQRVKKEGCQKIRDLLIQKGIISRDGDGNYHLGMSGDFTDISIVGRITAGRLLPAISADFGYVRFEGTLTNCNQLFALEVVGDSMIGDDIENGDCVLIRKGELRDGQIGAVVIDDETTLKRVYRLPGGIKLVPSNPFYDSVFIPLDEMRDCNVLGSLEAIISRHTGDVRWINARQFSPTSISLYLN